jgi:hypothetical protein
MKNQLFALLMLASCSAPSCFNASYESARMLKKGTFDARGHANLNIAHAKESEVSEVFSTSSIALGVGLGYGISDKFNVKFNTAYNMLGIGMIELSPKVSIIEGKIAAALPLALYFSEGSGATTVLKPQIWLTLPAKDNKKEVTLGLKSEMNFQDLKQTSLGITLGGGFSSDLDKWSIRPEIGLAFLASQPSDGQVITLGIGANYVFPNKKSKL